jgi:hypothetical protein
LDQEPSVEFWLIRVRFDPDGLALARAPGEIQIKTRGMASARRVHLASQISRGEREGEDMDNSFSRMFNATLNSPTSFVT